MTSWIDGHSKRPARTGQPGQEGAARAFVLVGCFEDPRAVVQASRAFEAAGFGGEEILALAGPPQRITEVWGSAWAPCQPVHTITGAEDEHNLRIEQLLAGGGALVVVRSPVRFHKACEIIERAGGRVGIRQHAGR